MSYDLIVYLSQPLSNVVDDWEIYLQQLDERLYFDPTAKEQLKTNAHTLGGFFPVGSVYGFDLFSFSPDEEERRDVPTFLTAPIYAVTFSIQSSTAKNNLYIGCLSASALASVGGGVVLDTYTGNYLSPEQAVAYASELTDE